MSNKNTQLTKVGYRATEKTVRIGNLYDLRLRVEERDIVGETRIERVFSLSDAAQSAIRFLLWLVGLPVPMVQAVWSRFIGLLHH